MKRGHRRFAGFTLVLTLTAAVPPSLAMGRRGHGGGGRDPQHEVDHEAIKALLARRADIRRTVAHIEGGVKTTTESDVPEVARLIQSHVKAMYARMKDGRPIHRRDPLFAALFESADKITMTIEPTPKGLRVREVSTDPRVVKLIRAHAQVVSDFLAYGHTEVRRDHPLP